MELIKKVLVLIILAIFIYIIFRLIQKRIIIKSQKEGFATFDTPSVSSIVTANTIPVNITNNKDNSKPIKSYFIKSSIDSAYDGTIISTDMIIYNLQRGYRFLDLEVFLESLTTSPDGTSPSATVAFSNTGSYPRTSANNISFISAIQTVLSNAFSNTTPNSGDPLFLQIRPMYRTDDSANGLNTQLNTQIEVALDILKSKIAMISSSTTLSEIAGKIVILMDKTSVSGKKTANLMSMINDSIKKVNYGLFTKDMAISKTLEILPYDENNNILTDNINPNAIIAKISPNFYPVMSWQPIYINGLSALGYSNLGLYENLFYSSAFLDLSKIKSGAADSITLKNPIVAP